MRLRLVALAALLSLGIARSAQARDIPLSLSVSFADGPIYGATLGVIRDDVLMTLRIGFAPGHLVGRYLVIEGGFDFDLERLELAARLGVRVRPWAFRWWSPYVRAEAVLVGKTYLGNDWQLVGGVGAWVRPYRYFALFTEVDAVGEITPSPLVGRAFRHRRGRDRAVAMALSTSPPR